MPKAINLKALRDARMLSQSELADRSGVPQPTISKLENGRSAHQATIRKLAKALRIEPERLVAGADGAAASSVD